MMSSNKIMLIACGSFNPPTPMHFRMFEIAKDHFAQLETHQVVGGIVSPVHDSYGKKGLVSATHRLAMVKIALQSSDWIRLSDWECHQDGWTRTRMTLQYHQNYLNSYIKDLNGLNTHNIPGWISDNIKKVKEPIQVKLLCGADLLESFATPGLWQDEDIEAILGNHGIVVISRNGSNPEQFIFNSDLLTKYKRNITIVTNWVTNDVSSTLVRRFLNRGMSVKYLLEDKVIDYIKKHGLYGSNEVKYIQAPRHNSLTVESNTEIILTPVSPETCNESFVKQRNVRNEVGYESMDETDSQYPSPRSPKIDPNHLSVEGGSSSLHQVFCCAQTNGTDSNVGRPTQLLTRPGGAVQIITDVSGAHTTKNINVNTEQLTKKVGVIATCIKSDKLLSAQNANNAQMIKPHSQPPPLPSPPCSPAQSSIDIKNNDEDDDDDDDDDDDNWDDDSERLRTRRDSTARVSPSKSYSELVQFVFTEHGIKVISDREYVV